MKKLSLGKLKLASEEVLQRSELVNIYGGSGSETCGVRVSSGSTMPQYQFTSGSATLTSENGTYTFRNLTYEDARQFSGISGASWCCSSCSTSSWY